MKKSFNLVAALVLAGGYSLAQAQSAQQDSFADRFRVMQSESSESPMYQLVKPTFSAKAEIPTDPLTVREYQALSSESPAYQLNAPTLDNRGATFAQTHPHGLSE